MKLSLLAIAGALATAVFGASGAAAAPTPGQWTVEVTAGPANAHFNTVGICITAEGSWSSTTQRRGSGRWLVSGGNVLWRGNYDGGLNDAAVLAATSPMQMSGPLMQWMAGTTDKTNMAIENVFGNSVWRFRSAKCDPVL